MWQLQRCSPGTKFHTGSAIWRLMRWMRLWRRELKEGSLKGIEIINTLSVRKGGHAVFRETETAEQCRLACAHFSGLDRKINKEGRGWFVPMFFNEEPKFWTEIRPVDVVTIQVGPMDQWGNFYLGPTVADIWGSSGESTYRNC